MVDLGQKTSLAVEVAVEELGDTHGQRLQLVRSLGEREGVPQGQSERRSEMSWVC